MGKWLAALALLGAGCADDGPKMGPPLESSSPIVATGRRNGRWTLLLVRDAQQLSPTAMYCASPHDADNGPFTFYEVTRSS